MRWETLLIKNQAQLTPRTLPVAVSISKNEILICGGYGKGDGFVLNTSSEPVLREVFNIENFGFLSNSNQVLQTKPGQIVALVEDSDRVLHLMSYNRGDSSLT